MTSSTSSSNPGPLQVAAALLSPLLILVATIAWLGAEPDTVLAESAARIDAQLAAHPPRVVVLGNSLANSDIDAAQLAAALGMAPEDVYILFSRGSRAPWWYAALKNRVYDAGHSPELVVVVNTMASLLSTQPTSQRTWQLLSEQMTDHEPVLQERLHGERPGNAVWERMKRRRLVVRDQLLNGVRDAAVPALFESASEPALERVFSAEGAVDMALHSRVIPIVEDDDDVMDRQGEGSLLPELLALATDGGSRVVFVRTPLTTMAQKEDDLPAEDEREAIAVLNAAGAGYINLRDAAYTNKDFVDPRHMGKDGRQRFTAQVALELEAMGALSEEAMRPAALPLSLRLEWSIARTGALPTLPVSDVKPWGACGQQGSLAGWEVISEQALLEAGLGRASPLMMLEGGELLLPSQKRIRELPTECSGAVRYTDTAVLVSSHTTEPGELVATLTEAVPQQVDGLGARYWIYPGTTLQVSLLEADAASTAVAVTVRGLGDAAPTLLLEGQPLELTALPGEQQWKADVQLTEGQGTITISAGDGFALLTGLTVGSGDEAVALLETPESRAASLLADTLRFPHDPPALEATSFSALSGKGIRAPLQRMKLPQLAAISNTGVLQVVPIRRASPVLLLRDGQLLPQPAARPRSEQQIIPSAQWWDARCPAVQPEDTERFCHAGEDLLLFSADGSTPEVARYRVQLDPERSFGGKGWWLYPGDRMVAHTARLSSGQLQHGVNTLHLAGASLDPSSSSPVQIRLLHGDEVLWKGTISAQVLNDGPLRRTLPAVLYRSARDLKLVIETQEDGGYVAITEASLLLVN